MAEVERRIHVSLVAIPDAMVSSIAGMYEVLGSFPRLGTFETAVPRSDPFRVEIVASDAKAPPTASGLPVDVHRSIGDIDRTDVVIVPSVLIDEGTWRPGRNPEIVHWLTEMHDRGAVLCSACSGVLLLAETGRLDGWEATIHWAYATTFRRNFPKVRLRVDQALVVSGERGEFVMSGASASWHDLVLFLVARHVGPTAAQAISKFMLLQWHAEGQAPYIVFDPPTDHGDAAVLTAQQWLARRFNVPAPVEEMVRRSGIPERTFHRRFAKATGLTPMAYVQHLRVEEAKRRLERTDDSVEKVSWSVGYEDPAFFRRVFHRVTRMGPGAYRRKFRVPNVAKTPAVRPGAPSPSSRVHSSRRLTGIPRNPCAITE